MFASLMIAVAVSTNVEVIDTTARLDLRVRVVEAIEGGPVIVETTLTNTSGRKLRVHKGSKRVGCSQIHELPKEWNVQGRHLCGYEGIFSHLFEPGETWHCRHVLHDDWVSHFPAGKYRLTVVWPLEDFGERRRPARTVAVTARTVEVSIEPASPKVLTALAKRVETMLAAVPLPKDGDSAKRDDLKPIAELVVFTRHEPLVPAIRKVLDRCVTGTDADETQYIRGDLIHTLLAIDTDARSKFVDSLTGKSPPHYAASLIDMWRSDYANATKVIRYWYWQYELDLSIGYYDPAELPGVLGRKVLKSLIDMFLVAPPRLLPPAELERLAAAPNFWVRAITYASFADRLDSAWKMQLLAEARQPEKHRGTRLGPHAIATIQSLDRQPGAAKLLAALADGPETDPVAIAARKRQTELAPRP